MSYITDAVGETMIHLVHGGCAHAFIEKLTKLKMSLEGVEVVCLNWWTIMPGGEDTLGPSCQVAWQRA